MTAHGMEYSALFGQVGSARPAMFLPGFQGKLTLSWLNPGQAIILLGALLFPKVRRLSPLQPHSATEQMILAAFRVRKTKMAKVIFYPNLQAEDKAKLAL